MIGAKLWERYLFKQFLFNFLVLNCIIFITFVVFDLSAHLHRFVIISKTDLFSCMLYYLSQWVKHADIFINLSLLIGTIKVLLHALHHHELLALQSSTISKKRLIRPLLFIALLVVAGNLLLREYAHPSALPYCENFQNSQLSRSYKKNKKLPIHMVSLQDHSKFIYQRYDPDKALFYDVTWIDTKNHLWHMKSFNKENNQGYFVDYLAKNEENVLEKMASYNDHRFDEIHFSMETEELLSTLSFQALSPSELSHYIHNEKFQSSLPEIRTHLYYKLFSALFPLLLISILAPFCMNYKKSYSHLITYAASIFAFFAFHTFFQSMTILSEYNALSVEMALVLPFSLVSLIAVRRFVYL